MRISLAKIRKITNIRERAKSQSTSLIGWIIDDEKGTEEFGSLIREDITGDVEKKQVEEWADQHRKEGYTHMEFMTTYIIGSEEKNMEYMVKL